MSILHQFQTSLSADNAYQSARPFIGADDGLLFMGEALYGLLRAEYQSLPVDNVYLLAEDVTALGLTPLLAKFTHIDYAQWVQLTLEYDKVISW